MEKIKDTKLGAWLKEKAPGILDTVGDLLPDKGGLGVVKNLLDREPDIDPAEAKAKVEAEIEFQKNVTERWKAHETTMTNPPPSAIGTPMARSPASCSSHRTYRKL